MGSCGLEGFRGGGTFEIEFHRSLACGKLNYVMQETSRDSLITQVSTET